MFKRNLLLAGISLLGLALLVMFVPFRAKTIGQNDSAAVGRLRLLAKAQVEYRAAHPERGYACSLSELDTQGLYSGYLFSVRCRENLDGKIDSTPLHYELIAQPVEVGVTGLNTFCMTEIQEVWFDDAGFPRQCLAIRRPLERN